MQTQGSYSENAPVKQSTGTPSSRPTFLIACWLLALLAFAQLITIGAALTSGRTVAAAPKTIPKTVPKAVTKTISAPLRVNNPEAIKPRSIDEILASVGPRSRSAPTITHSKPTIGAVELTATTGGTGSGTAITVTPSGYGSSMIADPVAERLVRESRALQLDGDMMRAMLKLDEAARRDPSEAAVIYHKGLLFEEMGLYTKAADQYQQVQQMGIKAGAYFRLSAKKLTKGMDVAHAHRPVISIGPMNARPGNGAMASKQTNVAVTILARPDKAINPADVHVQVHFYDRLNSGEIKKASSLAKIDYSWDEPADWKGASREETVHFSYAIPEADRAEAHLFGRREFFGYVVELVYKGEVIDQQASPRRLNSIHGDHISPQYNHSLPWLPGDQNSLLPSKDDFDYDDDLPSLPQR